MREKLVVVTASCAPEKTLPYWSSFRRLAESPFRLVMVVGGQEGGLEGLPEEVLREFRPGDEIIFRPLDGTIPAFMAGLDAAVGEEGDEPEVIACFHDDLEVMQEGWDFSVNAVFASSPKTLLAGFGGGTGLGAADIYETPYSPFQLARQDFVSNMRDAEAHGRRSEKVEKLACTDGFAIIGRAEFIHSAFRYIHEKGVVHHAYDSWIGGICRRLGGEARLIPVACHHAGGMTAVGSQAYNEWARTKNADGDAGFWEQSHKLMYEDLKGVLPFNCKEEGEK